MVAFVTINPAVLPGGYDMRSDLIGGIHTPASKIQIGALGVDGGFVHAGNPLPVALVAGTISGVATEATLAAVEAVLDAIYARMASGAQHVQVDNFPGATGLTDAQLRASPVSISAGALPLPAGAATSARQDAEIAGLASIFGILGDGTQHVRVDNFPSSSGGLTDAELRASPVPVSGPLTDAQLRASAVPVSATSLPLPAGASTAALQAAGNASLASIDGKAPALVAGRVPVDGSGATQPISAAALPLPSGAATSANQTSGAQKAIARSGAKGASAAADVTSTDVDANTQALDVVVKNTIPIAGTIVADQGAAGVDPWLVDATGSVVAIGASALPSGAATSANQATEIAALNSIDAKLANPMPVSGPLTDAQLRASAVPVSDGGASLTVDSLQLPASLVGGSLSVDGSGVTQPVSAAALPLPAGASTSALQATGNASLASIDGKLANPLPVSGTVAITDGGGSITVDSLQLPSALVSGRLSVDGSAVTQPISAAALPLPAGAATEATLATRAGEHVSAASPHACRLSDGAAFYQAALTGQFPAALASGRLDVNVGASALPSGAAQEHVGAASFHSVRLTDGAAFYVAPAAAQLPAALVGGRLDANVGAWLGATTPTVGQKTMAASLPVAIASDQGTVTTKETRSATCTTTTVAASASSGTLLAANANRLGASIYNDSASAYLYVKCGTTASATSFEFLLAPGGALGPGGYAEIPFGYTGRIDGIWTAAVGNARIGEFT